MSLLNKSKDITHPENTRNKTIGVKNLKSIQLFAHTYKLDRFTSNRPDRKSRTTLGITVKFCENHPGDIEPFVESRSDIDSLLAGHRISYEKNLTRRYLIPDSGKFAHQKVIYLMSTRSIKYQSVKTVQLRILLRVPADFNRVLIRS